MTREHFLNILIKNNRPEVREAEVFCSMCSTAYVEGEHRAHAENCPMCRGSASIANASDKAMQQLASDFDSLSDSQAQSIIDHLSGSFWRAEFRAALKKRIAERI